MNTTFAPELTWPTNGTPLFRDVHSRYRVPVTEEVLAEIVRRIVDALHPEKIILFGSYAYGQPNKDSDIDLFIIQESNVRHALRTVAISELLYPRPFPVDIIVKTPAEVREALQNNNYFIREIIEKGRVLYEQPSKPKRLDSKG